MKGMGGKSLNQKCKTQALTYGFSDELDLKLLCNPLLIIQLHK